MIRIQLTDDEAQRLEQAFRLATDRKHLDRLQIVRLAHRGRKHRDIAADLGISTRTVRRWLNAYLGGGLEALRPRKARGHAAAIPSRLAEEVRRRVIDGQSGRGLDRANWTHAELADHLRKSRGISAAARPCSDSAARRASAPVARPTASCGATRSSRPRPPAS